MTASIVVTGFSAFPGAPLNPSEELVTMLGAAPPVFPDARLAARLLPVEYGRVASLLAEIGAELRPDIAIHFGLAETARGFRLESTARNLCSMVSLDAAGALPLSGKVTHGPARLRSGLPLGEIATDLRRAGLPVQRSADAGDYLCNYTFYLSRADAVPGFAPSVSGFVHIPYLDDQLARLGGRHRALPSLSRAQMMTGARIIVERSLRRFRELAVKA